METFRKELLNAYVFTSLTEVREKTEQWMIDYNNERPHKSLGYKAPKVFAEKNYKRPALKQKLYPQMANENHTKIEESHLVDKIINDQLLS